MKKWIDIPYEEHKNVNRSAKRLIDFCLKYSRYVVLTRRHEGGIPEKILLEMEKDKLEQITERNRQQMEFAKTVSDKELERIGMGSRKQLADYFMNQLNREKREIREMVETYAGEQDNMEEKLKPYGLVKRDYTFGGFMTWPDIWDICWFEKEQVDLNIHEKKFFDDPTDIGEYSFEDLGFADADGDVWVKTCLHEGMLNLYMDEKQLAEFEKIGIKFMI